MPTPDDLAARGAYEPDLDEWAGLPGRLGPQTYTFGKPIPSELVCPLPALRRTECPACLGVGGDGDGPCPSCRGRGYRSTIEPCGALLELRREVHHGLFEDGLADAPMVGSIVCEAGHVVLVAEPNDDGWPEALTPALAAEAIDRLAALDPR